MIFINYCMEDRVIISSIWYFEAKLKLQNLFLDFFIFLTQNFIQNRNNFVWISIFIE